MNMGLVFFVSPALLRLAPWKVTTSLSALRRRFKLALSVKCPVFTRRVVVSPSATFQGASRVLISSAATAKTLPWSGNFGTLAPGWASRRNM